MRAHWVPWAEHLADAFDDLIQLTLASHSDCNFDDEELFGTTRDTKSWGPEPR
jgi:hypothetical protein